MASIELTYEILENVREKLNRIPQDIDDDTVNTVIQREVLADVRTSSLSLSEKKQISEGIFSSLRKELDFLEKYLADPEISEIMVNGRDQIFVEKHGILTKVPEYFPTDKELTEVIMRIASRIHREINEMNPILDARLKDGSRVHAVYKNVAIHGPTLNIRKFPKNRITMEDLINGGSITREAARFLEKLVASGYNIFVSGGTSSGKTTMLNALSDYIPPSERVIVIEDSAELRLEGIKNIVNLETRNANAEGKGEVTMRQLIKASLRMRPDRILVGEVRGAEVVDMISAMNTGHDGSLSTGHANSARGMLSRLETMFLTAVDFPIDAVRSQIASAIDIIVHLGRLKDSTRRVLEIVEIAGYEDGKILLSPLFRYELEATGGGAPSAVAGRLVRTENELKNTTKLDMYFARKSDDDSTRRL